MAGEVEESISFQVECLSTDSVSFGRFEEESLSWERRSSFSHNRYLEEVKKYSKPGSVIEKKAYFEAHFKRKALLREVSSESQYGFESQSTENCVHNNVNYVTEFEDHGSEENCFVYYDEMIPDGSQEHEYEVIEIEREEHSHLEFQKDPIVANADAVLDNIRQILHSNSGCDAIPSDYDRNMDIKVKPVNSGEISKLKVEENPLGQTEDSKTEVELNLANGAENIDGIHKRKELSLKIPSDGVNQMPSKKKPEKTYLNIKSRREQKMVKTKASTPLLDSRSSKKISNEKASSSCTTLADKAARKTQRESSLRNITDGRPPRKVPPISCSPQKTLKPQDSEDVRKVNEENRSGKDLKSKKVSTSPQRGRGRGQPDGCDSISRPKHHTSSSKPDTKLKGVTFNFKSEERAERRKEFYMKLGEKQHAKEVEMNQIQAKTQQETEAEIKQFRRSLNFKATPMPSFYYETMPRSSDGRKLHVAMSSARTSKLNSKRASPGKKVGAYNLTMSSRTTDQQGLSTCELPSHEAANKTFSSTADSNSVTQSNRSKKIDEVESSPSCKKTLGGKKERERVKTNRTDSIVLEQLRESDACQMRRS